MIPELGHFALILTLCLSLALAVFPLVGAHQGRASWMAVARTAAAGQFVFVAFAFGCLVWAFVHNDFSVLYVATNSNSALPTPYRIAAVWGAHEGSLLLWVLILAGWTLAVATFSRNLPERMGSRVLGVLGLIMLGFLLFVLTTSNPFDRLIPAAMDGNDLNPLLQDPALVIHPPMLYMGYVGLSVAFAFAVAAMLEGKLDSDWARWTRPWTIVSWMFLTLGIALGSWWAYYELGWGGWWFWDPVENASFMPWLMATALIHSLAVTETRGLFKSWTLLLAIFGFSLSLLGTFLVRSGVLISVHAFASDPSRGLFILIYLAVVIGGALALFAFRAPKVTSRQGFRLLSRETFLLSNNILLVAATALILQGTLYPLFMDALELGKVSVGPPYFNSAFLVPIAPLLLLLGVGMHAAWIKQDGQSLFERLRGVAIVALAAGVLLPWAVFGSTSLLTVIGCALGLWVLLSSLIQPLARLREGKGLTRGLVGMSVAHIGVAVCVLGVTITSAYNIETDLGVQPGETVTVGGYDFTFQGMRRVEGPNYIADEADVRITRDGELVAELKPQKREYRVQKSPMTEAGIDGRMSRDLFVALGDPLGGGAWSMRIQYKPLVRFIWIGAILMALGGALAASDRRYRVAVRHRRREKEPVGVPAGEPA